METAHWVPPQLPGKQFVEDVADGAFAEMPRRLVPIMEMIGDEVASRFSGCGSPIPEAIEARRIVDLGCGTGRDVFLCSSLAGPKGFVLGIDNEVASLKIARRNVEPIMTRFGHPEPNVAFRKGSIDDLEAAELQDGDFDVVISNRALNLVSKKIKVLREVHRILKDGGEFYFSDVFSDRRIPRTLAATAGPSGEGLAGVLYLGDFIRMARKAGFADPRAVVQRELKLADPDLQNMLGGVRFRVVTFRLFKLQDMEVGEEDYGQVAVYSGSVPGCAHHFHLDEMNHFEKGRGARVGGNTALILQLSRLRHHFELCGPGDAHFGPFVK